LADPSIVSSGILIRACVVATGGSKDYGLTLFASQLNEMEEDVASTDSRFRLRQFYTILSFKKKKIREKKEDRF
jgi:hypothetical protein